MPLVAQKVINPKTRKPERRYLHQQFDGSVIDPSECTCLPFFASLTDWFVWREECPIDDHKCFARLDRARELDEEDTAGILARKRFELASLKRQKEKPSVTPITAGARKSARVLHMPLHREQSLPIPGRKRV